MEPSPAARRKRAKPAASSASLQNEIRMLRALMARAQAQAEGELPLGDLLSLLETLARVSHVLGGLLRTEQVLGENQGMNDFYAALDEIVAEMQTRGLGGMLARLEQEPAAPLPQE